MSIIETNFGTRLDPKRVALGSATNVTKQGAFYVFSLRVDTDDIESILLVIVTELLRCETY